MCLLFPWFPERLFRDRLLFRAPSRFQLLGGVVPFAHLPPFVEQVSISHVYSQDYCKMKRHKRDSNWV